MPLRAGFCAVLMLLFLSVGCGLFGGDEEFEIMVFEEDLGKEGGAAASPTQVPSFRVNPEILEEVKFLYRHQVRLERFQRVIRDLTGLVEYENASEVDLEWVVEVHEVTAESEEFFDLVAKMQVPPGLLAAYNRLFIGALQTVEMTQFGSDRLLAAAIKVGPNGRGLLTMPEGEADDFHTFIREARFYLRDSEKLIERERDSVTDAISGIRLR